MIQNDDGPGAGGLAAGQRDPGALEGTDGCATGISIGLVQGVVATPQKLHLAGATDGGTDGLAARAIKGQGAIVVDGVRQERSTGAAGAQLQRCARNDTDRTVEGAVGCQGHGTCADNDRPVASDAGRLNKGSECCIIAIEVQGTGHSDNRGANRTGWAVVPQEQGGPGRNRGSACEGVVVDQAYRTLGDGHCAGATDQRCETESGARAIVPLEDQRATVGDSPGCQGAAVCAVANLQSGTGLDIGGACVSVGGGGNHCAPTGQGQAQDLATITDR